MSGVGRVAIIDDVVNIDNDKEAFPLFVAPVGTQLCRHYVRCSLISGLVEVRLVPSGMRVGDVLAL